MTRILVVPEDLSATSQEIRRLSGSLGDLAWQLHASFSSLGWEASIRAVAEQEVNAALHCFHTLSGEAEGLAGYLDRKAEAFAQADADGATAVEGAGLTPLTSGSLAWAPGGALPGWPTQRNILAILGLTGWGLTPALVNGMRWFRERWPDLFGDQAGVHGSTAPQPNTPVAEPEPPPATPPPASAVAPGGIGMTPYVPSLSQQDAEWKNERVIPGTFETQGCLLTAIAMVMKYNDPTLQIDKQFMVGLRDKVTDEDHDVVWGSMEKFLSPQGMALGETHPQTEEALVQQVLENLKHEPPRPSILGLSKGKQMHWLVVTGYKGDGVNLRPEDFTINDPFTDHKWTTLDQFLHARDYRGGKIETLHTISSTQGPTLGGNLT